MLVYALLRKFCHPITYLSSIAVSTISSTGVIMCCTGIYCCAVGRMCLMMWSMMALYTGMVVYSCCGVLFIKKSNVCVDCFAWVLCSIDNGKGALLLHIYKDMEYLSLYIFIFFWFSLSASLNYKFCVPIFCQSCKYLITFVQWVLLSVFIYVSNLVQSTNWKVWLSHPECLVSYLNVCCAINL